MNMRLLRRTFEEDKCGAVVASEMDAHCSATDRPYSPEQSPSLPPSCVGTITTTTSSERDDIPSSTSIANNCNSSAQRASSCNRYYYPQQQWQYQQQYPPEAKIVDPSEIIGDRHRYDWASVATATRIHSSNTNRSSAYFSPPSRPPSPFNVHASPSSFSRIITNTGKRKVGDQYPTDIIPVSVPGNYFENCHRHHHQQQLFLPGDTTSSNKKLKKIDR